MERIDTRKRLHLWAQYATEHQTRVFRQLLMRYPELAEAYALAEKKNAGAFDFVPERARARLFEAADERFMDRYTGWLEKNGIGVALFADDAYPALLREIHDPPVLLFYKGLLLGRPKLPVAVIGARRCTRYGREMAAHFSRELAEAGATVVSGLAAGADACAAQGALDSACSQYPTVAVLGSGIDVVYPSENAELYEKIVERGAIVTEFLPKTKPARSHFPIRNRIISGLSRGVLVVEAGERSGTSITAGYAHDQGRDVFAVPGRVTDLMSLGTNRMIQRGEAKPVFCAGDILCEYDFEPPTDSFKNGLRHAKLAGFDADERAILVALLDDEMSADDLCEKLSLDAGTVNSCLTALEFSEIIKQSPGRVYALDVILDRAQ